MLHSTCGSVSLKMWGRKCCVFDDFFPLLQSLCDPKICYKCVCGRGTPSPRPIPLGACDASTLSPVGDPPQCFFLQIGHWG